MFWPRDPFKATWLCTTHRWGQKTRYLLTVFGEVVLFQETGDVVLISPTFSQTDLFLSLYEYLIIGLWGTKTHPRKVSPLGSSCVPAFLRIPLVWTQRWDKLGWESHPRKENRHADSIKMWGFAACPPPQKLQWQGNFNQAMHLES